MLISFIIVIFYAKYAVPIETLFDYFNSTALSRHASVNRDEP